MIRKIAAAKKISAQQTLAFIWLILTIFCLATALYYQWHFNKVSKQQELENLSYQTKIKFDNLIEDLLNVTYSLPLYGHSFKDCQGELLPIMQRLVFNSPIISSLLISDKNNKLICSTLGTNYKLPPPPLRTPSLAGPFIVGKGRAEVFLLQQRMGEFYFGLYIMKSILENILVLPDPSVQSIYLYNNLEKKIVIPIGKTLKNPLEKKSAYVISEPLENIDNFTIVTVGSPSALNAGFFLQQCLLSLFIFFFSFGIYCPLRSILNKHFSLHQALIMALKNKEFEPVYQPIRDLSQDNYCGAEVLLRWQASLNQTIMPDFFIEEAELSGIIVPITLQIIERVFEETKLFIKKYPNFHFSFNISVAHFKDKLFFKRFYDLCEKYTVLPCQLILEITERELFDFEDPALISKMKELRERGYGLAVDDYGTGHASIQYLQHFPFNYLKIDKMFVHAIGTQAITEALNLSIIQMAHSLKLNLIAEGVETSEQCQFLYEQQVKYIQGWYFSKALSFKELMKLLQEKGKQND